MKRTQLPAPVELARRVFRRHAGPQSTGRGWRVDTTVLDEVPTILGLFYGGASLVFAIDEVEAIAPWFAEVLRAGRAYGTLPVPEAPPFDHQIRHCSRWTATAWALALPHLKMYDDDGRLVPIEAPQPSTVVVPFKKRSA